MTEPEFYDAVVSYLASLQMLGQVAIYALCSIAAAVTFQVVLYAVRNKHFWGAVLIGVALVPGSAEAAITVNEESWTAYGFPQCSTSGGLNFFAFTYRTTVSPRSTRELYLASVCDGNSVELRGSLRVNHVPTPLDEETARIAVIAAMAEFAYDPYSPPCPGWNCGPPCAEIDDSSVGLNCCGGGNYGATWYVGQDSNQCSVLKCNNVDCRSCPPFDGSDEGQPCACAAGGQGTLVLQYGSNGCPNGVFCDGCEPCPEVDESQVGSPCTTANSLPGQWAITTGTDHCPTLVCMEIPQEPDDPCTKDENEDGIPDYLEGNPFATLEPGDDCYCGEGKSGKIVDEENEDGCPVPTCDCDEEDEEEKCPDYDGDGCCDEDDPDPEDPKYGCEDCEHAIVEEINRAYYTLSELISLPRSGVVNQTWQFELDLGSTVGPGGLGQMITGDLNALQFYFSGGRPVGFQEAVDELEMYRSRIRNLLAAGIYCLFAVSCLYALFNPAR